MNMKMQIILTEQDIIRTIAKSFSVNAEDIYLRHFKESVGYGCSEEYVDKVEIMINQPMNDSD